MYYLTFSIEGAFCCLVNVFSTNITPNCLAVSTPGVRIALTLSYKWTRGRANLSSPLPAFSNPAWLENTVCTSDEKLPSR